MNPEIETVAAPAENVLAVCTAFLEASGGGEPLLALLIAAVTAGFLVYRKLRK